MNKKAPVTTEDTVEQDDREIIRPLAAQWAEAAHSDRMATVIRRWHDVNEKRPVDRPPVWCRPVGAWAEILPDNDLLCLSPIARNIERALRQKLIKIDIGDDEPVMPYFPISAAFRCEPQNRWGLDVQRHRSGAAGGAWAYDPPLKSPEDFAKLTVPSFVYDAAATDRVLNQAGELLGDSLPPRLVGRPPVSATLCTPAADLRGLTQMMLDTVSEPELLHRLMGVLRDGALAGIDAAEASGMLTPNTDEPMTCSEPFGEAGPDGDITCKQLWCMANSQEFDQVSPAGWKEFLLDYQMPIFERFGRVGYGCCENLTKKVDGVLSIPNLHIFVCSAWTDLDKLVDIVGDRYIIMWRQKATDVVFTDDLDLLAADLEDGVRRLAGCHFQIILRELQTLADHPRRLHDWARLAIAAAEKHASA